MTTVNPSNQVFTNNSDGFTLGGGTTERDLTVTGGNMTMAGSGTAVMTYPSSNASLAALNLVQTFTAQQIIFGTATNDSAASGYIGEFIPNSAAGVSVSSATATNITSISLTAGDWDVFGNIAFIAAASTIPTLFIAAIGQISGTLPSAPNSGAYSQIQATVATGGTNILPTGMMRVSLASTTTVYLLGEAIFSVSTMTASGYIGARRAR